MMKLGQVWWHLGCSIASSLLMDHDETWSSVVASGVFGVRGASVALQINMVAHTVLYILVMLTVTETQNASSVQCQEGVFGEIGTNVEVQCNINGDVEYIYWFNGTKTEDTLPMLSLENGEFGGTEYNGGVYELAENGWMTINNAQLTHEGTYTLKVYFTDRKELESPSKISVYIRPQRDCPVIDSCNHGCEKCHIRKDSDGSLHCSINGARPKLNIDWEIVSQDSANFVKNPPVYTEWGDTWNSSVSITYIPAECDAKAVLRCVTQNPPYPLKTADVVIETASCSSSSKTPEIELTMPVLSVESKNGSASVTLVILLLLGCIIFTCMALLVYHVFLRIHYYQEVMFSRKPDDKRNILVQKLVSSYMDKACVKPDKTTVRATYKNCACTYVDNSGKVRVGTVKDLYKSRFRRKNDRVLIVADEGFGKSTTTRKILMHWSESHHRYLLLYIPMDKLQPGKNVFEMVVGLYAEGTGLTTGDISELVKNYECLILLGDLEKQGGPSFSSDGYHSFSSESEAMLDLSFTNLLEGKVSDAYRQIKVWVTSRDDDDVNSAFSHPYTKATIKGELNIPV